MEKPLKESCDDSTILEEESDWSPKERIYVCRKPWKLWLLALQWLWQKGNNQKEEITNHQTARDKWNCGGIIGAAALTGGTLMAIIGLVAPVIAAGLGALAHTLGPLVLVIGASGFAVGTVASSFGSLNSFGYVWKPTYA